MADSAAQSRLAPCPDSPNCVSSRADPTDVQHWTEPLYVGPDAAAVFARLTQLVADLPRTEVTEREGAYLHAEVHSRIFRFVDDLELERTGDTIHVRSASRLGYGDLGVNRRRVERLRRHAFGP